MILLTYQKREEGILLLPLALLNPSTMLQWHIQELSCGGSPSGKIKMNDSSEVQIRRSSFATEEMIAKLAQTHDWWERERERERQLFGRRKHLQGSFNEIGGFVEMYDLGIIIDRVLVSVGHDSHYCLFVLFISVENFHDMIFF